MRADAGSKYEELIDESISVKGYITIYYNRRNNGGMQEILLTEVSGGYTILDRQISVKSQSLAYGCTGSAGSQSERATPSGSSWSYTCPSNWKYVNSDALHSVGANCSYTLKRAGNDATWQLYVENNVE